MKLLISLAFLMTLSFGHSQGYRGHRFSISYVPAYSFLGYYSLGKPVLHNKLEVGMTLNKHLCLKANVNSSWAKNKDAFQYDIMYVNDKSVGLSLMYFRKLQGSMSPIGRFIELGIDYGKQNSEHKTPNPIASGFNYYYDDTERITLLILSVSFGRNFILKDRLILGYGMQFGFNLINANNQPARHLGKPFFNIGYIL